MKQVIEIEEEAWHSPQRDFSSPPPPDLEGVYSTTKTIAKNGKNIHFSSSSPATNRKGKKNLSQDHMFLKRFLKNSPY
jgi:hypothetical protein